MPWRGWLWLGKARREPLSVVLYTRRDCPLCDEAKSFLEARQCQGEIRLSIHDVDESAEWQRQYGEWVPVVLVEGRVRFRGTIDPILWRRLIQHADRAKENEV
jgi:glutaredoxin